jgi:hypothetical protein
MSKRFVLKMDDYRLALALFVFQTQQKLGLKLAKQVLQTSTVDDFHDWLRQQAACVG